MKLMKKMTEWPICRAILMMVCGVLAAGCVNEDWSDCFPPTVTVTLRAVEGHEPIRSEEVDHIWLYIFREADGTMLDRMIVPNDQIGVPQIVDYPRAGALKIVAVANCMDAAEITVPERGAHISTGEIGLVRVQQDFQGKPRYELCDDMMWGETVVLNSKGSSENAILPIKRIVAGIFIRVSGLENIPGIVPSQMQVALGANYNRFAFTGIPGWGASRAAEPNLYHVPAAGCSPSNANVVEVPALVDGEDQFFRILSTDAGDGVTISLFDGGRPFGTHLSVDKEGNPLKALNGKLNVFELNFDGNGQVGVTVSQAKWGDTPPMEIEF